MRARCGASALVRVEVVGRVAEDQVVGRRARRRARATTSWQSTRRRAGRACSRFALDRAAGVAVGVDEDARARRRARAPRARAPPEPANRSSTVAPSTGPIRLNAVSRTKSDVGRVFVPFGASIRCPLRLPAMIRTASRGRHGSSTAGTSDRRLSRSRRRTCRHGSDRLRDVQARFGGVGAGEELVGLVLPRAVLVDERRARARGPARAGRGRRAGA